MKEIELKMSYLLVAIDHNKRSFSDHGNVQRVDVHLFQSVLIGGVPLYLDTRLLFLLDSLPKNVFSRKFSSPNSLFVVSLCTSRVFLPYIISDRA